jgi:sarcosine oxidase
MYHLARRGLSIAGVDQFAPPHSLGSSHGQTRIIRKAYFEHPDYVPLLHRAWSLWDELQQETGRTLLHPRPLVMTGPPQSEVVAGARRAAAEHQLPLENLSAAECMQRFPTLVVPDSHDVAVESSAGILMCDDIVDAHLELAESLGALCLLDEPVRKIQSTPEGARILTDKYTIEAATAVVTCGAWTASLLPDYRRWIRIVRKTVFWHPAEAPYWAVEDSPIFLQDLPQGQFYGLPAVDGGMIKVGEHTGGESVDTPEAVCRDVSEADRRPIEQYVAGHLKHVQRHPDLAAVCLYSMSPDGHFLFDSDPDRSLVVAAGFSGHGFKFTGILGSAAADLVISGRTDLPVSFLSRTRLT